MAAASPLRILIADDDQDTGEFIELILIGLGHQVHLVNDGAAAVHYAQAHCPDLILMDVGMPGLNGFDAAQRIRSLGKTSPVIVALTGWNREEDIARGVRSGMDHHLPKPFDLEALRPILDSLVSSGSGSARRDSRS
jgi:CheY-like chemotaxis protein